MSTSFDNRIQALEHDLYLFAEYRPQGEVDKWRRDLERLRRLRDEEFEAMNATLHSLSFARVPEPPMFPTGEEAFRCRSCQVLLRVGENGRCYSCVQEAKGDN